MRLLVCDDHEVFLEALVHALRELGHDVTAHCRDPELVLDLVAGCRPEACILDVDYQGTERLDLAADVRHSFPATKVLLLSGWMSPQAGRAVEAGWADGLLCKTCDVQTLEAALCTMSRGMRIPAQRSVGTARPTVSIAGLTEREQAVLRLIVHGASTLEIASTLGVSLNTVRTHVQHVLDKLGVHSRAKAAALVAGSELIGAAENGFASA